MQVLQSAMTHGYVLSMKSILKEKVLEYKKQLFVKGAADIRRKLALRDPTEDQIIAEFERLRHAQSRSPVA